MILYRYVRPMKFDPKRGEGVTAARGGVCLRFESFHGIGAGAGPMWFSHSRCHPDELFSKDIARKIAIERAQTMDPSLIRDHMSFDMADQATMVRNVIHWCETWDPVPYPPLVEYARWEFHALARSLTEIVNYNQQEVQKMRVWIDISAAARIRDQYGNLSR